MSLVSKIAPALLLSGLLMAPAAAAPVGPNTLIDTGSLLIQVRDGGHGGHGGKGGHRGGGNKGHHGGNKGHHGGGHAHGNRGHGHGNWHGGRGHGNWHGHGGHGRWVAGRTYYVAPPGWRQYGARPGNWQTLGCVIVNGFWFCP